MKALKPRDVVKIATENGFAIRYQGTRIIISSGSGRPLSISGHTNEDYDKGLAAAIRQWFRERGITVP